MGRSITPTFRVEYTDTGSGYGTPEAWPTRYLGPPTDVTLAIWADHYEKATKFGGVNQHLADGPEGLIILSAKVIRQKTGEVMATYD